jgi:anaerobic ribonucleoside-triphosphate reductase activating protein
MNIYGKAITCVCFMGGDGRASEINALAAYMRTNYPELKTGWYSGREEMDSAIDLKNFNYIKLGPYIEERGPLSSPTTNQRLLKVLPDLTLSDITYRLTK